MLISCAQTSLYSYGQIEQIRFFGGVQATSCMNILCNFIRLARKSSIYKFVWKRPYITRTCLRPWWPLMREFFMLKTYFFVIHVCFFNIDFCGSVTVLWLVIYANWLVFLFLFLYAHMNSDSNLTWSIWYYYYQFKTECKHLSPILILYSALTCRQIRWAPLQPEKLFSTDNVVKRSSIYSKYLQFSMVNLLPWVKLAYKCG